MAINYIKGEMLTANLLRDGIDLAIETDVLYVDVTNSSIGINNATPDPASALDVTGDIKSSAAVNALTAAIGNVTIGGSVVSSTSSLLTLSSLSGNISAAGDLIMPASPANITGGADGTGANAQPALTINTSFVSSPYYLGNISSGTGISFNTALATAKALYVTPDGSTVFFLDGNGGGTADVTIYESALGTDFDLSTAGVATSTTITGAQVGPGTEDAHGITFNPNGREMFISKYTSAGAATTVEKIGLSVAFNLASSVVYSNNTTYGENDTFNFAPQFSEDGLKAYSVGVQTATTPGIYINEYTLPTYELTVPSALVNSFDISTEITHTSNYVPVSVAVDGLTIFAAQYDGATNKIASYTLNPAYDISSAVSAETITEPTAGVTSGIFFAENGAEDGNHLYWSDNAGIIYQYDTANNVPDSTSAALSFDGTQKLVTTADGVAVSGELVLPSYTTATLPATTNAGAVVYDTTVNELKVNDGTNWTASGTPPGVAIQVLTATSTGAVEEEALDSLGGRLVLPNFTTWRFEANIVARRTDADGSSAGYKFTGVIERHATAGTTGIVGIVAETIDAEDNAAWTVTVDDANDSLNVRVTGDTGETVKWVIFVRIVAVTN